MKFILAIVAALALSVHSTNASHLKEQVMDFADSRDLADDSEDIMTFDLSETDSDNRRVLFEKNVFANGKLTMVRSKTGIVNVTIQVPGSDGYIAIGLGTKMTGSSVVIGGKTGNTIVEQCRITLQSEEFKFSCQDHTTLLSSSYSIANGKKTLQFSSKNIKGVKFPTKKIKMVCNSHIL